MGCATPVVDAADAEATSSTATAIVVVERSSGPGEAVRADAVFARFIRVKQGVVDDSALRIAGVAEDIPEIGTCAPVKDVEPAFGSKVELLDVGQVTLDDSERARSTVLGPRTMPDPAGFVSGVFYTTRSQDVIAPGGVVSLRTSGSKEVPAFALTTNAPREIGDVHVSVQNGALDVQWESAEGNDLVYVDVLAPAPRIVVRCAVVDTGRVFIPAAHVGAIEEGQVAVHRVHREQFRATGIAPGEVRFDLAKIVAFRR